MPGSDDDEDDDLFWWWAVYNVPPAPSGPYVAEDDVSPYVTPGSDPYVTEDL